jgi:hypothetical protein
MQWWSDFVDNFITDEVEKKMIDLEEEIQWIKR